MFYLTTKDTKDNQYKNLRARLPAGGRVSLCASW
jgi:hypothetical protein